MWRRVEAGLLNLNEEFDTNPIGALFINSSHGMGPDLSQVGPNGPGIFPITGLGARVGVSLSEKLLVKLGVFEGTPGSVDRPRRTVLKLQRGEGVLALAEGIYRPGPNSRFGVGLWYRSRVENTDDPSRRDGRRDSTPLPKGESPRWAIAGSTPL